MTVVTVRPDETVSTFGFTGVGGALHTILADNSDASYAHSPNGVFEVGFAEPSLPAGSVAVKFGFRVRAGTIGGDAIYGGQISLLSSELGMNQQSQFVGQSATTSSFAAQSIAAFPAAIRARLDALGYGFAGAQALVAIYELYLDCYYAAKPELTVDAPTGTVDDTNFPEVTWTPDLDADGGGQTAFEVKIFDDATYTPTAFDPDTSTPLAASGVVGSAATSWSFDDAPLFSPDTYRAYVRIAQTINGEKHWSGWEFVQFDLDVPAPGEPTSFIATAEDAQGRIRLDVTADQAGEVPTNYIEIQRSHDGGTSWENLRTSLGDGLLGVNLCTNGRFLQDTDGWINNSFLTFQQASGLPASPLGTTTGLHFGNDESGDYAEFRFPVVEGQTYDVTLYVRRIFTSSGDGVSWRIHDENGVHKYSFGVTFASSIWAPQSGEFTADSTGTWSLRVRIGHTGGGGTGSEYYMTDVFIAGEGGLAYDYEAPIGIEVSYRARDRYVLASGLTSVSDWVETTGSWESALPWLKHPTDPDRSLRVKIHSYPGAKRAARQGVFQPLGEAEAVAVSDTPGPEAGTLVLRTDTDPERDELSALLAEQVPLLLQVPPQDHEPDRWLAVGDTSRDRWADKAFVAENKIELAWTDVARPEGRLVG